MLARVRLGRCFVQLIPAVTTPLLCAAAPRRQLRATASAICRWLIRQILKLAGSVLVQFHDLLFTALLLTQQRCWRGVLCLWLWACVTAVPRINLKRKTLSFHW